MNNGERAELKFIATLGCFNSKILNFKNHQLTIKKIETPVGTGLKLIQPYNYNVSTKDIANFSDEDLIEFCNRHGISKAGIFSKADVLINGLGYSLKYTNAQPPAIVNHTRRSGWEFAAKQKKIDLIKLDAIIQNYWSMRNSGMIGEDTANSDPNSPFVNHLNSLLPFLEYFIFEGTGTRLSNHPASEIIDFSNPCDTSTWEILNKTNLIQKIWPRLVFSMRSDKGMPNMNTINSNEKSSLMIWAKMKDGSLKGALHVRIR